MTQQSRQPITDRLELVEDKKRCVILDLIPLLSPCLNLMKERTQRPTGFPLPAALDHDVCFILIGELWLKEG